jgi:formate hydrogenlyase subunit 4
MFSIAGCLPVLLAFCGAPLLFSVINRTKAKFAGRRGAPWLQPYFELAKLLRKSAVYSRTTTPLFTLGPMVSCAATATALLFVPLSGVAPVFAFPGDVLWVVYLLGTSRFFMVLAALDTGSSFEGMGANREVFFSALAEPALLLSLTTLAVWSQSLSLGGIYGNLGAVVLAPAAGPPLLLVAAALLIVFLAENARIPVDDPTTHLELTMIHEVMILDHSGPDFALIQYAASLRLWLLGSLLVGVVVPWRSAGLVLNVLAGCTCLFLLAVLTGIIESVMARLRLVRVPEFLIAASVLSIVALVLMMR